MDNELPPDVTKGASLQENDYGWDVSSFPDAVMNAVAHNYACLGGQFQFRLSDGSSFEMYWLNADSTDRAEGEPWAEYSHRSCTEVLGNFQKRVAETDFAKEAMAWPMPINHHRDLVFVAYFVTEVEFAEIVAQKTR